MDAKTYEYMNERVARYKTSEESIKKLERARSVTGKAMENYDFGFTYGNGSQCVFVPKKFKYEFCKLVNAFIDECIGKEKKIMEEI